MVAFAGLVQMRVTDFAGFLAVFDMPAYTDRALVALK
jgi:hypothetical protein